MSTTPLVPEDAKIEIHLSQEDKQALRDAADKMKFSKFIGDAWDTRICKPELNELMHNPEQARLAFNLSRGHQISGIILLDSDKTIKKEAGRLKIPDALFIETGQGDADHVTIRACDFKFNIAMAEYAQVGPKTLIELLNASPAARGKVQEILDDLVKENVFSGSAIRDNSPTNQPGKDFLTLDQNDKIRVETGRFIAPETQENVSYFNSLKARIRRDIVYRVQLSRDQIAAFFKGYPGSEMADQAARLVFGDSINEFDKQLMTTRAAAAMSGNPEFNTPESLRDYLQTKS